MGLLACEMVSRARSKSIEILFYSRKLPWTFDWEFMAYMSVKLHSVVVSPGDIVVQPGFLQSSLLHAHLCPKINEGMVT